MKNSLKLFLLSIASLSCCAVIAGDYNCTYRENTTPIMDGKLSGDPFWDGVTQSSDFLDLGDGNKPSPLKTWFKMAYTKDALYIGVWCEEPQMDEIISEEKSDGEVWRDDGLEIFLAPPSVDSYFQFVLNTSEARYSSQDHHKQPLLSWSVKCFKATNYYSFEICFPYTTLMSIPKAGECWFGNIGRNQRTQAKEHSHSTWAPLKKGFHDRPAFPKLVFPIGVNNSSVDRLLTQKSYDRLCAIGNELKNNTFSYRLFAKELAELTKSSIDLGVPFSKEQSKRAEDLEVWGNDLRKQELEALAYKRTSELFNSDN